MIGEAQNSDEFDLQERTQLFKEKLDTLEKIRAVHGGAFDVDENFVVMHHGIGHFDPREALIVIDFDYVHGVFLLFTVKFFTEIFTII